MIQSNHSNPAHPGVSKIMVTGTSLHSTKEALRLTRLYPDVLYSTAGIKTTQATLELFQSLSLIINITFSLLSFSPQLDPIDFFLISAKLPTIVLTISFLK